MDGAKDIVSIRYRMRSGSMAWARTGREQRSIVGEGL